ncbi:MAG TPA: hypothetical protein VHH11_02285 [Gammaproteobacteria bacterium]|nr:hypothetical protein [Gammaproteobacteria bacterium]
MIEEALRFARDVLQSFTWQKLLLAQLVAGILDIFAVLLFVYQFTTPPTFSWSRVVIEETMAFSILLAVLAADQAVARGARPFRAYALAIVVASVVSAVAQFWIRGWLGLYTISDQPGNDVSVRRSQMIYAGCDTLTYGVLFILLVLDYRRRERLLRRVRAAELERARREQRIVQSQLAALRTDVDAVELLATLDSLQRGFESGRPDADQKLDAVIASLRAKLAPVETERPEAAA